MNFFECPFSFYARKNPKLLALISKKKAVDLFRVQPDHQFHRILFKRSWSQKREPCLFFSDNLLPHSPDFFCPLPLRSNRFPSKYLSADRGNAQAARAG